MHNIKIEYIYTHDEDMNCWLQKASPSICYNLLNILNAYALMILHYNGEHESAAMEACIIFLELNDVIGGHKVFEDPPSAVTSVFKKAIDVSI